jgi:hypothetical protein
VPRNPTNAGNPTHHLSQQNHPSRQSATTRRHDPRNRPRRHPALPGGFAAPSQIYRDSRPIRAPRSGDCGQLTGSAAQQNRSNLSQPYRLRTGPIRHQTHPGNHPRPPHLSPRQLNRYPPTGQHKIGIERLRMGNRHQRRGSRKDDLRQFTQPAHRHRQLLTTITTLSRPKPNPNRRRTIQLSSDRVDQPVIQLNRHMPERPQLDDPPLRHRPRHVRDGRPGDSGQHRHDFVGRPDGERDTYHPVMLSQPITYAYRSRARYSGSVPRGRRLAGRWGGIGLDGQRRLPLHRAGGASSCLARCNAVRS